MSDVLNPRTQLVCSLNNQAHRKRFALTFATPFPAQCCSSPLDCYFNLYPKTCTSFLITGGQPSPSSLILFNYFDFEAGALGFCLSFPGFLPKSSASIIKREHSFLPSEFQGFSVSTAGININEGSLGATREIDC